MACKQGIRKSIEVSKKYYEELKKYDPMRALWESLVNRVYKTEEGFDGLTEDEQMYVAVTVLDGEVNNGGMDQFFFNSSGSYYDTAVNGLIELKATNALRLLTEAGELVFNGKVSQDREERWEVLKFAYEDGPEPAWVQGLERIDGEYWADPDQMGEKLEAFARDRGLVQPFEIGPGNENGTR